jgi:hypothetical protein
VHVRVCVLACVCGCVCVSMSECVMCGRMRAYLFVCICGNLRVFACLKRKEGVAGWSDPF